MIDLLTEEYEPRPKRERKKRQVRRKGNNRIWAKWLLRQAVVRTYRAAKVERPKGRINLTRMLGYSHLDFLEHIQAQFTDGMTWERIDEIHIDHIIPMKWFIKNGYFNPLMINDLSNLRPVWAKDNLVKGADLPDDFQQRLDFLTNKYKAESDTTGSNYLEAI